VNTTARATFVGPNARARRVTPTVRPRHATPGLTWRSLASPAFDKWVPGILGGLFVGWTYLPIALWVALFGALAGAFSGAIGGASSGIAHTLHVGVGVGFSAAVIGLFVGALNGLVFLYAEFFNNPLTIIGGLISGLAVSLVTLWVITHFEDQLLRLRGYRELSRREKQLVDPIARDILDRLGVAGPRPTFYVSDSKEPAAWTHANSIVLAQGLLGAYDDSENPPIPDMPYNAFAAVIAHEISHWARADGVGIRAVWACCWPIVAVYNFVGLVDKKGMFVKLAWLFCWPAWVSIKLGVAPTLANSMREAEYQADALTASLGDEYRAGLRTALGELQDWEAPRTGWEDVLHATHPPIELRQQRLETPQSKPVVLESSELGDITVTAPEVLEVGSLWSQAYEAGNLALVETRQLELDRAIAAWLRQVKQAKEQGEPVDVSDSLDVLDSRIADFDRKASGGANVTIASPSLGDIVCYHPDVLAAGLRCNEAKRDGDGPTIVVREVELLEAAVHWLRRVQHQMENDQSVIPNETVEGLAARIADYEQKAAALRQPITDGPATTA
jgi:Zn-dependent protease with chaperone function